MPSVGSWAGPLPAINVGFSVFGPPNYLEPAIFITRVSSNDVGRTFLMPPEMVDAMQGFGTDHRPVAVYSTVLWDCSTVSQNCRIGRSNYFPFPAVPSGTRFSRVEMMLNRLDIVVHNIENPPGRYTADVTAAYTARFYVVVPEPHSQFFMVIGMIAFLQRRRHD